MNNTVMHTTFHEVHHKFMKINRLHRSAVEKRMSNCEIHRSQHMLLMFLHRCEKTPTQREIADRFEISPAAVATSLKKLEADGYITRQTNESDVRQNMISITDKGRKVVEFSKSTFDELDRMTYDSLTEQELCELDRLLTKIIGSFEER